MRTIARGVAFLSLILLTGPAVLFLLDYLSIERVKLLMLIATVVWFVFAAMWIWKHETSDRSQVGD